MASNSVGPIYLQLLVRCPHCRHQCQYSLWQCYCYYCLNNCYRWLQSHWSHSQMPSNHNRWDVPGLLIFPALNNSQLDPIFGQWENENRIRNLEISQLEIDSFFLFDHFRTETKRICVNICHSFRWRALGCTNISHMNLGKQKYVFGLFCT